MAELVRAQLPPPHRLEHLPVAMACVATRRSDAAPVAFTAIDAGHRETLRHADALRRLHAAA